MRKATVYENFSGTVANIDKEVKLCPFCGGSKLRITSKKIYENCFDEHDGATIGLYCINCSCDLHEHIDNDVRDYESKLQRLIAKWNCRMPVDTCNEEDNLK